MSLNKSRKIKAIPATTVGQFRVSALELAGVLQWLRRRIYEKKISTNSLQGDISQLNFYIKAVEEVLEYEKNMLVLSKETMININKLWRKYSQ